jgi:two-component system invasion response regulator UvrY
MHYPIAFVDDTVILRRFISSEIEKHQPSFKIYQYDNGKDFIEKFEKDNYEPYVVIMDISMPFVNGYEATAWLRGKYVHVPILAYSMIQEHKALIKMYQCGANGFITKNKGLSELFEAIKEIKSGNFYFNLDCEYKVINNSLYKNDEPVALNKPLTYQEEAVLKLIATERRYQEIADDLCITYRTMETHKRNISQKLDIHTREGLILYAIKTGIVNVI